MGFQNIGCPAGEEFTGSGIKQYLKVYFPQWLNTYNFDNYTNYIFNAEINRNKVDLDLLYKDQPQYLIEKKKANNRFVTAELLNLGHFIEWIEKVFKTNLETDHEPDFFRYKKWFETNDDFYKNSNQDFLLDLKNKKPLSQAQFDGIIYNKIDSLTKEEAMYFLTLMYLDFVRTQGFLHSKFEPLPKEKAVQKTPLIEKLNIGVSETSNDIKKKAPSKAGRKKTEIKPAINYLQGFIFDENKIKFLTELKNRYNGSEPKTFNYVIGALESLKFIKVESQKAIKEAFEKEIEPKKQSQTNFDNDFRNNFPDEKLLTRLKNEIESFRNKMQLF